MSSALFGTFHPVYSTVCSERLVWPTMYEGAEGIKQSTVYYMLVYVVTLLCYTVMLLLSSMWLNFRTFPSI